MTKKSPENEILAKGNNSCKSMSNATKVKLDLYYVKQIHMPNSKSISQRTTEKSSETRVDGHQVD